MASVKLMSKSELAKMFLPDSVKQSINLQQKKDPHSIKQKKVTKL